MAGLRNGSDRDVVSVFDTIDELLTGFENDIGELATPAGRKELGIYRRQIAAVRRYLAPQRDALDALVRARTPLLTDTDAFDLREHADRTTRYVEDLDLARERSVMLREELQNIVAEQQNSRMYVLSSVAAIFLPLSFLTGVFGMNVAGLPGTDYAGAFLLLSGVMVGLGFALVGIMRWKKWL